MRKERKLFFCLAENVLADCFRSRNKFGMTFMLLAAPFYAGTAGAEVCIAEEDCNNLGYTETQDSGDCIKCPFGKKWYCSCDESYQYTCTGANESKGEISCDGKYKSCTCSSGYEWKDGKCIAKKIIFGQCNNISLCNVGDVLYSNGTCSYNNNEPIGVVVAIKGSCHYAMTINPIKSRIAWSTKSEDIGTSGIDFNNVGKNYDGCVDTRKIIQHGDSSKYPAAWAAVNYAPSVAPETKGKWCLPTAELLFNMGAYWGRINNGISKHGGTPVTSDKRECIWTSSEHYTSGAWAFCSDGYSSSNSLPAGWGAISKSNTTQSVRPILIF